ncbi:MAG: hypothetical protein Tsb0013_04230 [Phycisphaerales bacterium]
MTQTAHAEPRVPIASLRPIADGAFGYDEAKHLLLRAGFAGTPAQIRTLADWGPQKAVDHLLASSDSYPDDGHRRFDTDIMRPLSPQEQQAYREALRTGDEDTAARFRARRQDMQRADRNQIRTMQEWWLARMIETPRPLEEKMTLFWHSHFATGYRKVENSIHLYMQNRMFREHALGNFGELLFRIIRDPAMLKYLDNDTNRARSPNENLAREIMELFSLGEGSYTENDIKNGAKALTGYTYEGNDFYFNNEQHDNTIKRFLGKQGNLDGDDFVRAILEQPACAHYITQKLYRHFTGEFPDERSEHGRVTLRVIKQLASTMRAARYEIKPVLRELLLSEHFYDPALRARSIKSPAELIVGAVRTLSTPVRDLSTLNDAMGLMGQTLFQPPNVAGWSGERTWINTSTIYVRQNALNYLLTGRTPAGLDASAAADPYDPAPLLDDLAASDPGAQRDPEKVVRYLLSLTLAAPPTDARVRTLLDFVNDAGGRITKGVVTGLLALIAALPEYQLK